MTGRMWRLLILLPVVSVGAPSRLVCQEAPAASRVAVLETPHALRMEHAALREELAAALADTGGVGDAARSVKDVLTTHLQREETGALRLLGLLRGMARDASSADVGAAIALSVDVARELPALLEEHRVIGEASKRLADVARRERKPDQVAFANQLWLHARIEEEVLYPAALLIGEYLRIAPDRKHTASKP